MSYLLIVQIAQGTQELLHHLFRNMFWHCSIFQNQFIEVLSLDVVHHLLRLAVEDVLKEVQRAKDIWMTKMSSEFELTTQCELDLVVVSPGDFNREWQLFVYVVNFEALVYHRMRALSKFGVDDVIIFKICVLILNLRTV